MFENKTLDNLHEEMLSNLGDDYDKIVGSFPYDLTRIVAIENEKIYKSLDKIVSSMQIENLEGDELDTYVQQRTSIERKSATPSVGYVTVYGNGTVNKGSIFETESGVQFEATQTVEIIGEGQVPIQSIETGLQTNVPARQIKVMPVTLSGITSVINAEATKDGFDEEADESLRERYYEKVRTPGTSGNIYHYLNWAKEIPGVGNAKVFPLWNGNNTVKVLIIDSTMKPASAEIINKVQAYIDPDIKGDGSGQAPIGAFCTVATATQKTINIKVKIVLDGSILESQIKEDLKKNIEDYFSDIAFVTDYVSFAKIGALILETKGIQDYSSLLVNEATDNVQIGEQEVAVLGGIEFVQ